MRENWKTSQKTLEENTKTEKNYIENESDTI